MTTRTCDSAVSIAGLRANKTSHDPVRPERPFRSRAPERVAGNPTNVTLCPLYAIHHKRFAVYLKVMPTH